MLGARVALLASVVVSLATNSEAQSQCTIVHKGYEETPRSLDDVFLSPGEAMWTVSIPTVCRAEVGIKVTVCDADVPPEVNVVSLQLVQVVRRGALAGAARVSTVVYCASGPGQGAPRWGGARQDGGARVRQVAPAYRGRWSRPTATVSSQE